MIQANILTMFSLNSQGRKKKDINLKEDLSPCLDNIVNCCQKAWVLPSSWCFLLRLASSPLFKENERAFSFVSLNKHFILITSDLFLEYLNRVSLSVLLYKQRLLRKEQQLLFLKQQQQKNMKQQMISQQKQQTKSSTFLLLWYFKNMEMPPLQFLFYSCRHVHFPFLGLFSYFRAILGILSLRILHSEPH